MKIGQTIGQKSSSNLNPWREIGKNEIGQKIGQIKIVWMKIGQMKISQNFNLWNEIGQNKIRQK